MNNCLFVLTGYLLDLKFGDPYFKFHPVKIIGNIIYFLEDLFNYGSCKKVKGLITLILCVSIVYAVILFLINFTNSIFLLNFIISSIFFYWGIANKQLIMEGKNIINYLKQGNIDAARFKLSMIVGRDTENLNEHEIKKAVIETMSENLNDGVIAPLFYFFIGGLPLMYVYKSVNTLDSMIGYKNEIYEDFGYFSAKTDDILNFIPSRLTGILIAFVNFNYNAIIFMVKYGKLHSSPNAGYPEAAIAGVLDCKLGGNSSYNGIIFEKAYMGKSDKEITLKMFQKVIYTNQTVTFLMILIILAKICN
jgi:adenosylcobinamide-phosphate synthase